MQELTPAARLSAWGNAALEGAISLDDAADAIAGSGGAPTGSSGWPASRAASTWPTRWDGCGPTAPIGLRLVLPRPGDIGGLPGLPPSTSWRCRSARRC